MNITELHLNTGAMALGALPEDEAVEFVDHLATCDMCSEELAGFLETSAILGSSVAQTPPASLRRSVMEAVSRTVQLPPLTNPVTDLGRHRQAAAGGSVAPAAGPEGELAKVIPMQRTWYRRPQAWLAAAVAVLIIGGGTTGVVLANRSSAPPSAGACVAAAADRAVIAPTVGKGGDVALAPSCDAAVISIPTLPAAPSGKVYQLWVIKGTNVASVGVLKPKADGSLAPVTTDVRAGDTAVGVSVEPTGGSLKPTTTPIWIVPLVT